MQRLAMAILLLGLIASARMGLGASSSAPERPTHVSTRVDWARAAIPLPRLVEVAPGRAHPVDPPDPDLDARRQQVAASRSRPTRSDLPPSQPDVWTALAACESGGNPRARSANGRYLGAFQFSLPTWRSLGLGGDPRDHPYEAQRAAAQQLQARAGWGQWPRCARRLGLR